MKTSLKSPVEPRTFYEHLDELRGRIIACLLVLITTCVLSYAWMDVLLADLLKPIGRAVFTSPGDAFMARMQLMLVAGIFFASPFLLYQVWQFVKAALREEEKKYARIFGPVSVLLFMLGVLFGYYVAVPFAVKFLLGFASERMVPMITVDSYISFVGSTLLAFGIVFEMPLVMAFLTRIGIATPAFLAQKRRHAIVLILIVSAIITPPDIFSQIIMAIPLLILYEIGVIASQMVFRRL